MGMSLEWAEIVSTWSNWVLLGALLIGVFATYGIVVSSNVKEAALTKGIADANARALEAQAELAKYKGPRVLTGADIEAIASQLRRFPGQEYDLSLPQMLEPGAGIHTQLVTALHRAGWKLRSFEGPLPKRPLSSMVVMSSMDLPTTEGQHTIFIPEIMGGASDGMVGVLVGFEPGDSLTASGALLTALHGVGLDGVSLVTLSPLQLGVATVPQKSSPTTVHLIIGRKS
jgi:hypothetical protein